MSKPKNLLRPQYRLYLLSSHWQSLRALALEKFGFKCGRCGKRGQLQVHHKFYRSDWYETQLDDLEVLCRKCHKKEHGISDKHRPALAGSFTLLWSKILDSSIWVTESKETRLVWITLLAMKDSDGVIQASVVGLADRAKVSLDECKEALRIFLSPDPNDSSGVENGIRIREVPGGWQIVNHDLYRFSTDAKRAFWREQKARQRAKNPKNGKPLKGEVEYVKALEAGASEAELNRIEERHLPVVGTGHFQ